MQLGEDTTTMSMTLNPVNEAAFQKAVQSLETLNRAAVFHPTGTGKSCIAWKVVEAHPQTTFFWLVAGAQRLALRQAELTRYNGGTLPGNVRFCDCEKLAAATPEQWVRLGEQKPGCIVLDCYHELSAVCWAQSVQKLLRMCPQAKVLGLGVPNGAPRLRRRAGTVCRLHRLPHDCGRGHGRRDHASALSLCGPALASGGGAGHPARPDQKPVYAQGRHLPARSI